MTIYRPVTHASPQISVIVPTLPDHSIESLEGLKDQRGVDYEVIIVEDDSLDICEARNEGILRSTSELIALTDDDTNPPDDWLLTAVKVFEETDIVLLGGPVGERNHNNNLFIGCNVAFTKAAWRVVGGFDSRFAGWMDDIVFGWEIQETLGRESTKYHTEFKMLHPPPLRSEPDNELEKLARKKYPEQFFETFWDPSSPVRKLGIYVASRTYRRFPSLWERLIYVGRVFQNFFP